MSERRVRVYDTKSALASAVAARFIRRMLLTLESQETAHVVLTGGSMGEAVLSAVRDSPKRDQVDWQRVTFWWGDDRYVPRGHADRNELQSRQALLDLLSLPEENVQAFPALGDYPTIENAAAAYAATLRSRATPGEEYPQFDLCFLGVGPDGHVASLFPEHAAVQNTEATVLSETESPKPPSERLTLTLPVLNSAKRVWLVVAGTDKAGALGLALAGAHPHEVPVAGVTGRRKTVFFVDRDAAAEVPESLMVQERFWTAAHDLPG